MGMNVGSSSSESDPIVDVNTTPLIDLMLVLIVMLIMTLPPQTHAVKLDLPVVPGQPPEVKPEVIDIVIDFDNTITWNGNIVASGQDLQNYLRYEAQREPKSEVHLRPNKLAKYDAVAKVLATAKRLGVTNIGIMGNEQLD